MSEDQDRYQTEGDKERASDDKDVEGHGFTPQTDGRAAEEDTDEPDVEGHAIVPQTSPQTDG